MKISMEREDDGRWIAEVEDVPGCLQYGDTPEEAIGNALVVLRSVRPEMLA